VAPAVALAVEAQEGTMAEIMLDVKLEKQDQDRWCWAAVSMGIANAYGDFAETQQCVVASRVLSPLLCCPKGKNDSCNVGQTLTTPLNTHLQAEINGALTFAFVKTNIDDGNPIAVRIGWGDGGNGHAVVISGYYEDESNQDVYVCDPYLGGRGIGYVFEEFRDNWQQQGAWTFTYLTTGVTTVPECNNAHPCV
jgi:hypothetical protein